jgi:hypothetical protein
VKNDKKPDEITGGGASPIILFERFVESLGISPCTAWRWRKQKWLTTLNIAGRVYISREEIARFQERAAAGEFSKPHKAPNRKAVTQ